MSSKINAKSSLYIALVPTGADDSAKNYQKICAATECLFNTTFNKVDKTYFCNGGDTTSIITGRTNSITVTIDIDSTNPSHRYLLDLLTSQDFSVLNSQYFKIEYPLFDGETTPAKAEGLSCIQFKNNIPSGAANEIVSLSFDIFPQDEPWTLTPATLETAATPAKG